MNYVLRVVFVEGILNGQGTAPGIEAVARSVARTKAESPPRGTKRGAIIKMPSGIQIKLNIFTMLREGNWVRKSLIRFRQR
jgi:hypothetical protein